VVDQQPIGCEQFRQFCEAVSDRERAFICAYNFLEVVEEYETADVEERPALAALTVSKFFDPLRELLLVEDVRVCAYAPNDNHCPGVCGKRGRAKHVECDWFTNHTSRIR
jgi:hypothetical protein